MPTPKPLRILVVGMEETPEIVALRERGHFVDSTTTGWDHEGLVRYDLIVGPNCWRLTPKLTKYLDLAVKEARRHRYGPRKGKEDAE